MVTWGVPDLVEVQQDILATDLPCHMLRLPPLQGLKRVQDLLADEALDAPAAPTAFAKLLDQAGSEGWLPPEMAPASAGQ